MARKEGMKVDEDKQPRRRRGGSWEEARVGLLPITGLSQVKIIIFQLFFYVARQTFGPVLHFFHVGSIKKHNFHDLNRDRSNTIVWLSSQKENTTKAILLEVTLVEI